MSVEWELLEHEVLCGLLVRLEDDRYDNLMIEALPSVHLSRWQGCSHFESRLARVELAIVHDKVQPRAAAERQRLVNGLFEEAIFHDSPNPQQRKNCGSL